MKGPLFSPRVVRALLAEMGLIPQRGLGQNFLVDGNVARAIVDAIEPSPADAILEIGPGLGVLTDELAEHAGHLTAVEKDPRLAAHLQQRYEGRPHVEILAADFFDLDLGEVLTVRRIGKVVGNLPYRTGSRMLVEFARLDHPPPCLVVTVQSEVADRLLAAPGTAAYGLLTVWIALRYHVESLRRIRPSCFYPRPEVSSTTVRLTRRSGDSRPNSAFYVLTREAFQHRRKQLVGWLARIQTLPSWSEEIVRGAMELIGVPLDARPEALSPEQWRRLSEHLQLAHAASRR